MISHASKWPWKVKVMIKFCLTLQGQSWYKKYVAKVKEKAGMNFEFWNMTLTLPRVLEFEMEYEILIFYIFIEWKGGRPL